MNKTAETKSNDLKKELISAILELRPDELAELLAKLKAMPIGGSNDRPIP